MPFGIGRMGEASIQGYLVSRSPSHCLRHQCHVSSFEIGLRIETSSGDAMLLGLW